MSDSGSAVTLFSYFFPQIIDSNGFLLYIRQNATKGRFSFTTEKQDTFDLCFYSTAPMGTIFYKPVKKYSSNIYVAQ